MNRWPWWLAACGAVVLIPLLASVRVRRPAAEWPPALSQRVAAYLAENRQGLDLNDFRPTLLKVTGKRVILLGEEHGVATMEDLDLAMLRYLHRAAGVRVYVAELGYAFGCMVERYLETGNETVLDGVMRETAKSVAWTKERRAFFVHLREWNETLPEDE